ncbi:hypothetical protein SAMN06296378_2433 [Salinibacterium xinjiangense]|uniref:Lipoprotein n=1 Tax=Salinibacterium xinjiangense TaxID=386302 RepID=A0A2C9A0B5_9MICO|nr:hypothetical protein [Salinibacterium xinjiangense]SOE72260.1 hypothetical protein SAMN06296378_2433 [Salinibacterium xinjiangense]
MKIAEAARVLTVVAIALTMSGCQAVLEPRSTMGVDDVGAAFTAQADLPVTNPRDITADACATNNACIAVVRSEEIAIYRFESPNEAEKFAETLGENGYQSDWIVLEYPGAKFDTDPTKLSYAGLIDSMWTSD